MNEKKVKIKYCLSRTLNMGNYESVKFEVGLEVMSTEEDKGKDYEEAQDWVDQMIEQEHKRWKEERK